VICGRNENLRGRFARWKPPRRARRRFP
jgi:hypothetical protein